MKHPEELITHLIEAHDIKPWSIFGAKEAQENHHWRLHYQPRKPVDHEHDDA